MKSFLDNDEKLNLFKEWGLVKGNTTQIKELFYNKNDKFIRCDVIGYYRKTTNPECISKYYDTLVIKLISNEIIKISPEYLMQINKAYKSSVKEDFIQTENGQVSFNLDNISNESSSQKDNSSVSINKYLKSKRKEKELSSLLKEEINNLKYKNKILKKEITEKRF